MNLDPPLRKARRAKSVTPRLMRYNYARNRPASAPERAFSCSINAASPGPFGSTTCLECFLTSVCWTANTYFFELNSKAPIIVLS